MRIQNLSLLLAIQLASVCEGGVLVTQSPHPYGGFSSDTAFYLAPNYPFWQLEADDVVLSESAEVGSISWYGFYDADNPPSSETIRVRFYDARPGDGLPGSVSYEELFENPSRIATGRIIHVGVSPHEYRYQVDLTNPQKLAAGDVSWIEIAQIGDVSTDFRWETSLEGDSRQAYLNPVVSDWRLSVTEADLAFALYSPEPGSLSALGICSLALLRRRAARRVGVAAHIA